MDIGHSRAKMFHKTKTGVEAVELVNDMKTAV
jgi:hypothetical protein